ALASLGMSGATQRDAGLASGLFNTAQQIGAALGVAVLSTLAAAQASGLHATGTGSAAPLAAGYHVAFAIGTGLTVAAIIVAAAVLRPGTGSASRQPRGAGTRRATPNRAPNCQEIQWRPRGTDQHGRAPYLLSHILFPTEPPSR